MSTRTTRSLVTLAAAAVLALGGGVPTALAKHGADDPAGHVRHGGDDPASHDARDDKGGKRAKAHHRGKHHHRRHHGRRHHDDGPNHT
jgi:hypothetical protein